jgi:tryptophanyl-tRNA synthetase
MMPGMTNEAPRVSLTGVKPTGAPHLGNYVGAIKPALELAGRYEARYFIADHHALTSVRDPEKVRHYTRSVAATWLAAGLDPQSVLFYKQSDVPETFELAWILSCVTGKGLMNRAHAYKAARDKNIEAGRQEIDAGINMGLYNYPILMAVDILIMGTTVVPVGQDQVQHVEYAADIAGSFNHLYGDSYRFTIPTAVTPEEENAKLLPGLDGRKMSKSYDNTIPLFCSEKELRKRVRKIITDSRGVEEAKDPESAALYLIYEQFATPAKAEELRKRLVAGEMGWGEAKDLLFEELNGQLGHLRARYDALMEPESELDGLLLAGAARARPIAQHTLRQVRRAVGIE